MQANKGEDEQMSLLKPPSTLREVVTGNVKVFCRFRPL